MKKRSKYYLYVISSVFFIISFSGMIYYGYKTFYIEKEMDATKEYTKHFVLIVEELDNEYWRLIERGAMKAAAEEVFI